MVARVGNKVTSPVPYKKNPDYKKGDGSAEFLPDEPHIGGTHNNAPKEAAPDLGTVRGGTTNPVKGDDGQVKRDPSGNDHGHVTTSKSSK